MTRNIESESRRIKSSGNINEPKFFGSVFRFLYTKLTITPKLLTQYIVDDEDKNQQYKSIAKKYSDKINSWTSSKHRPEPIQLPKIIDYINNRIKSKNRNFQEIIFCTLKCYIEMSELPSGEKEALLSINEITLLISDLLESAYKFNHNFTVPEKIDKEKYKIVHDNYFQSEISNLKVSDFTKYIHSIDQLVNNEHNPEDSFYYKSRSAEFTGREKEIGELVEFCNQDSKVLWWAITGCGGSGKSRLAYEFILQNQNNIDWVMRFLNWNSFFESNSFQDSPWIFPRNLFLVIDYVSAYAVEIGKWIGKILELSKEREKKIRILLIERETVDEYNNKPLWHERMLENQGYRANIQKSCFGNFIILKSLNDNEIIEMIKKYIKRRINVIVEDNVVIDEIVAPLKVIDENQIRPIFVLFITDAWIKGNSVKEWDKDKLYEWLVHNEEERMKNIMFKDNHSTNCFKSLLAFATAVSGLDGYNVPEFLRKDFNVFRSNVIKNGYNVKDIFNAINLEKTNTLVLSAIVPDIMGELFFLKFLEKEKLNNGDYNYIDEFVQEAWKNHINEFWSFLDKLIDDFNNNPLINVNMLIKKPNNKKALLHYCTLLVKLSYKQDIESACETLEVLRSTFEIEKNETFGYFYAKALYALLNRQDFLYAKKTFYKIKSLYKNFKNKKIHIIFAYSVYLFFKKKCIYIEEQAIAKLKEIYLKTKNVQIVEEYVEWLSLVSKNYDIKQLEEVVEKLRLLHEEVHSGKVEIMYRRALVNLSIKKNRIQYKSSSAFLSSTTGGTEYIKSRNIFEDIFPNTPMILDLQQAEETSKVLRNLYEKTKEENILESFAKSLFCLSTIQSTAQAKQTLKELKFLYEINQNIKLGTIYAKALYYLADKQSIIEASYTMRILESLSNVVGNEEIYVQYAIALSALANRIELKQFQKTLDTFKQLFDKDHNNEIARLYSNILFGYCFRQTSIQIKESAKILRCLFDITGDEEIALIYISVLDMINDQEDDSLKQFIEELKYLFQKTQNEQILTIYANKLYYYSRTQEFKIAKKNTYILKSFYKKTNNKELLKICVQSIIDLSKRKWYIEEKLLIINRVKILYEYSGDENVAQMYASALLNLCRESNIKQIVLELKHIYRINPTIDIFKMYKDSLIYLVRTQDANEIKETIQEINELFFNINEASNILIYPEILVELCKKQSFEEAKQTIEKLKMLYLSTTRVYLCGLLNILGKQNKDKTKYIVDDLTHIQKKTKHRETLLKFYIEGLICLLKNEEGDELKKTIYEIDGLLINLKYLDIGIIVKYAERLLELCQKQSFRDTEQIVEKLKFLYHSVKKVNKSATCCLNKELNVHQIIRSDEDSQLESKLLYIYIESLRYLHEYQNKSSVKQTTYLPKSQNQIEPPFINCVLQLWEKNKSPERKQILKSMLNKIKEKVNSYIDYCIDASKKQSVNEAQLTLQKINSLYEISNDEKVAQMYAEGLLYLIKRQNFEEAKQTIEKLKILYLSTTRVYLCGLLNIFGKENKDKTKYIVEDLMHIQKKTKHRETLLKFYIEGLICLMKNGEWDELKKTMVEISALLFNIKDLELVKKYAESLEGLCRKQGFEEVEQALEELKYVFP